MLGGMAILEQFRQLSLHEKLLVMEAMWDDISSAEEQVETPQWHRELLDQREELIQDGKAEFIDWEIAKKQIDEECP